MDALIEKDPTSETHKPSIAQSCRITLKLMKDNMNYQITCLKEGYCVKPMIIIARFSHRNFIIMLLRIKQYVLESIVQLKNIVN